MEAKKTKGRQKLEMKKIENEKALYIAFAKRKSGIYNKASEITTLCGAKVDILMFSPTGKSFCYGDPSLELITRSHEQNPQEGCIYHKVVEERKKLEIVELNEKKDELVDQMYEEKERERELDEILKTRNNRCGWWETKMDELSYEQVKEMEASLVDLQKNLMNELSTKCGDQNASHAPIDQSNGVNPHFTCANISEVAIDVNNEAYGISASESFVPDFSFSPTNEEQTTPIDQTNGINPYPTYPSGSNNEAYRSGVSESFLPDFSFSPTNEEQTTPIDQTNGINPYPTYPSGNNNEAYRSGASESFLPDFSFSPTNKKQKTLIDQTNGVNPYTTYASGSNISEVVALNATNNEDYRIGASESFLPDFGFSPTNEEDTFNLIPYDECRGDLFDFIIPPKNQANGTSLFLDDSNGSDESDFAFLPTNQAQGVNLTDASGSGSHALAFSCK